MTKEIKRSLLTDFSNLATHKWEIVNDGVMGGLSRSHLQLNESGNIVFSGELSLKNNGGFASVRNRNRLNLLGTSTFLIRLFGDGKKYSFRFRTCTDGVPNFWVYESRFTTIQNRWMDIELPTDGFQAVFRGKKIDPDSKMDLSSLFEYGFLISDKQEGDFRLEISGIYYQ